MVKAFFFVSLLSCLLLASCSWGTPAAQPVAERYLTAQASGDWSQFCSLLTKQDQEIIRSSISGQHADCSTALSSKAGARQAENFRRSAQGAQIEKVVVDDGRAEVFFRPSADSPWVGAMLMVKEDNSWRMLLTPAKGR
jgi:hypothetical protein